MKLALHVHRMGHHVRQTIVEQAKELVGKGISRAANDNWQLPETQEEINAQAEAALRDLFPRIPNFDKQMIIEHAFKKVGSKFPWVDIDRKLKRRFIQGQKYGKPKVGTSDLPLYRRVQLAVLAHIRHTHTRYDQLLREVEWHVARKAVEKTCLDILVKWRGDEETGRDQIDDILREVVVISDDSDGSDDSDDSDDSSGDDDFVPEVNGLGLSNTSAVHTDAGLMQPSHRTTRKQQRKAKKRNMISKQLWTGAAKQRKTATSKKDKRGFKRYEAVKQRWAEAVNRNRQEHNPDTASRAPVDRAPSQSGQQRSSVEVISPVPRIETMQDIRQHPLPQPSQGAGHDYGHRLHTDGVSAANYHREERQVSHAHHPGSSLGPSGGMVIGRRVGYPPTDPRAAPASAISYHGDLKDLLVPSVEPISPRSWQDAPQAQSVRRVIQEPMRPEQVPARQIGGPSQQIFPSGSRPAGGEIHNPPVDYGFRPATSERVVPRRDYHYERDSQPYPVVREVSRVYRVREPVENRRDPYGVPLAIPARVVRVHREARPSEVWEAEPARRRDPSPHRMDPYGRAPSVGYGAAEHRRIVYREASASGFEPYSQGPAPAAAPLFYEVGPRAQTTYWQGSTLGRPAPFSAQPQAPEGSHDGMVRHHVQDSAPIRHAPAEYHHIGQVGCCCICC